MTSTYSLKDYKTAFFKYRVLTKVHGQSIVDNLLIILWQLKRNAQCISCTLGGGNLGYLRLILSPEVYGKFPYSQELICAQYLWPFCLVVDSTNPAPKRSRAQIATAENKTDAANIIFPYADTTQQKATCDKALWLYLECQAIKQAIWVQLIKAIDSTYLNALRNSDTDMIHKSLPTVMECLMYDYSQVTLEDMHDKEQSLSNTLWSQHNSW